ncbi:MAG: 30S ribosomal protein S4 [Nanoarchaeota archaeon]|nr:30S ribosomal protein S4 [Nanoarchaeota archaeon]
MIRKKNKFSRPRKPFEGARIKEENVLIKAYGLKTKREIWKAIAKVTYFRDRAKALAQSSIEEQGVLFKKLSALGLKANSIADVLDLRVEDILNRRLPSVVAKKGLANTPQQARQMVSHKRVLVDGKVINAPSYLVHISEENSISIKVRNKVEKPKKQSAEKIEELEASI